MAKVGVLHENARISGRLWRKLISLMSIWTNYSLAYANSNKTDKVQTTRKRLEMHW